MGLGDVFDGQFAIEDSQFIPKPNQKSYDAFLKAYGVDPQASVFFEDLTRNLSPAKEMGLLPSWFNQTKIGAMNLRRRAPLE